MDIESLRKTIQEEARECVKNGQYFDRLAAPSGSESLKIPDSTKRANADHEYGMATGLERALEIIEENAE